MMMRVLILLTCLAAFASGTKYRICKSAQLEDPSSEISEIDFDGCSDGDDDPCPIQLGSSKDITIKFKATTAESKVKTYVQIMWDKDAADDVQHFEEDACKEGSGISCPMKENENYTYKGTVQFKPMYETREERWLRWELYKKKTVVCVEIKVKFD